MLTLRPTTEADLAFVLSAEQDPANRPYVGQWTKEQHLTAMSDSDMAHLIARQDADGRPVGYAILAGLRQGSASVELKRLVATEKGRGVGRTMLQIIKRSAFDVRHAHRLWLDVREHNLRAQHLYASEGFTAEGRLRECVLVDGRYESLIVMSILEQEYRC